MMSGSTCYQAIAYPLVTGETNVSLMDYTTRRSPVYDSGDLLVTITYHRLHGVMRSIPFCAAGRAEIVIPDSFRKMFERTEEDPGED
jgi:hypothetical protein